VSGQLPQTLLSTGTCCGHSGYDWQPRSWTTDGQKNTDCDCGIPIPQLLDQADEDMDAYKLKFGSVRKGVVIHGKVYRTGQMRYVRWFWYEDITILLFKITTSLIYKYVCMIGRYSDVTQYLHFYTILLLFYFLYTGSFVNRCCFCLLVRVE
jgi:hypothetical protein